MGPTMSSLFALGPVLGSALGVVLVTALFIRVSGVIRYIGNSRVAVVEKLWSSRGADSDDAAHPFQDDAAHYSEMIPATCGRFIDGVDLGGLNVGGQAF